MKKKNIFQQFPIIVGVICIFVVWKVWQIAKAAGIVGNGILGAIKNDVTTQVINTTLAQGNISQMRITAISQIAERIYNALWKDWFGMSEDEVAAMDAFKELLSTSEAIACAKIYQANFHKSLTADINKYCHFTDFDDVPTSLLNAIKNI